MLDHLAEHPRRAAVGLAELEQRREALVAFAREHREQQEERPAERDRRRLDRRGEGDPEAERREEHVDEVDPGALARAARPAGRRREAISRALEASVSTISWAASAATRTPDRDLVGGRAVGEHQDERRPEREPGVAERVEQPRRAARPLRDVERAPDEQGRGDDQRHERRRDHEERRHERELERHRVAGADLEDDAGGRARARRRRARPRRRRRPPCRRARTASATAASTNAPPTISSLRSSRCGEVAAQGAPATAASSRWTSGDCSGGRPRATWASLPLPSTQLPSCERLVQCGFGRSLSGFFSRSRERRGALEGQVQAVGLKPARVAGAVLDPVEQHDPVACACFASLRTTSASWPEPPPVSRGVTRPRVRFLPTRSSASWMSPLLIDAVGAERDDDQPRQVVLALELADHARPSGHWRQPRALAR